MKASDLKYVYRARRAGAHHAYKIVGEARKAGLWLDLAFALVEQESGFRNIFGCDHGPGRAFCHLRVTRERVTALLASGVANGVGLTQLTYRPFVYRAQAQGGAHKPRIQLRVGFGVLRSHIKQYGTTVGVQRYNGSGPAAVRYEQLVRAKRERWHRVLHPNERA